MQEQLSSAVTDKESTESLYKELKTQHTLLLQSHEQLRKDLVHTSSGRVLLHSFKTTNNAPIYLLGKSKFALFMLT